MWLKQEHLMCVWLGFSGSSCLAGEAEMNAGRDAAYVEFVIRNCDSWVITDNNKLQIFLEKLRKFETGTSSGDMQWAYQVTSEIAAKPLAKNPERKETLCTMNMSVVNEFLKNDTPFELKR